MPQKTWIGLLKRVVLWERNTIFHEWIRLKYWRKFHYEIVIGKRTLLNYIKLVNFPSNIIITFHHSVAYKSVFQTCSQILNLSLKMNKYRNNCLMILTCFSAFWVICKRVVIVLSNYSNFCEPVTVLPNYIRMEKPSLLWNYLMKWYWE